jgi:thiamine-phosphate pyrophosphorylase
MIHYEGVMGFDVKMLRVMAITDGAVERVVAAVRGGATCVQVRMKDAPARVVVEVTREIVRQVTVPVLVNDRFDVALAAGAAGVHVGADDVAVADVRSVVPPGFIIGTSVGCEAEVGNAALADFVGIGPVFETGSKHDAGAAIGVEEFARLMRATGKPAIGVGGITAVNAGAIIEAGGVGVAAIGAIFGSGDPYERAQALLLATAWGR